MRLRPFFVRSPHLYEVATRAAGLALHLAPSLYRAWIRLEEYRALRRGEVEGGIPGEPPQFLDAARQLAERGFDAVVFGHTHHLGEVALGDGARYLNPGSWLLGTHYVAIEDGTIQLREWS